MGGVILVSEGVGCNFWPREGCKNEVPAMGTPLLPPVPTCGPANNFPSDSNFFPGSRRSNTSTRYRAFSKFCSETVLNLKKIKIKIKIS